MDVFPETGPSELQSSLTWSYWSFFKSKLACITFCLELFSDSQGSEGEHKVLGHKPRRTGRSKLNLYQAPLKVFHLVRLASLEFSPLRVLEHVVLHQREYRWPRVTTWCIPLVIVPSSWVNCSRFFEVGRIPLLFRKCLSILVTTSAVLVSLQL